MQTAVYIGWSSFPTALLLFYPRCPLSFDGSVIFHDTFLHLLYLTLAPMNAQTPHNDADNNSQNGTPRHSSSVRQSPAHLDEYFQAARSENMSLFSKQAMHKLVQDAALRSNYRLFGHLSGTIRHAPLLTLALAGIVCTVVGFSIGQLSDYLTDSAAEAEKTQRQNMQSNETNSTSVLEKSSSDIEQALSSLTKQRSKNDADILPSTAKRRIKSDISSPLRLQEREELFPVYAGLPPARTSRLQSVHYLELSAEELQRLGVTISGKNTVEISRRLPQKDSSKSPQEVSFNFRAESLRQASSYQRYSDEQKLMPIISPLEATDRTLPFGIRPYILTDTLGRMLPVLPTSESFSGASDAPNHLQQAWQLLFRGYDIRKNIDTATTLIALRLQPTAGFHAELRNIVFWFRAVPALIELLPARWQEQLQNELRIATLSQRLAYQRKDFHGENSPDKSQNMHSQLASTYYLPQTQALIPQVLTLGSSMLRTKMGSPVKAVFSLHESRSVRIALHGISGSLTQECASVANALGQQSSIFTLKAIPAGMYFLVFRTDQNETALQYLFVE